MCHLWANSTLSIHKYEFEWASLSVDRKFVIPFVKIKIAISIWVTINYKRNGIAMWKIILH